MRFPLQWAGPLIAESEVVGAERGGENRGEKATS